MSTQPKVRNVRQSDSTILIKIQAEVEMIDQILSQEDQEFEALISLLQNEHCDQNHTASAYGSDDEEYEQLFKDVMSKEEVCEGDAKEAAKTNTDEIMDTSMD